MIPKIKPILFHVPRLAQAGKKSLSLLRKPVQLGKARWGYHQHGERYSQKILFVAGLPKSGTTWLERMLASFPGYCHFVPHDAVLYELRFGESHSYQLPRQLFDRLQKHLIVMKMHINGSHHNARMLEENQIPYVVLYRDLRDVAVSYVHYVRVTPWHPEFQVYQHLTIEDGLVRFANTHLMDYESWIRSWESNRHAALSLSMRYEDLLENTGEVFSSVVRHFELPVSDKLIKKTIKKHSFQRMSGGRARGEEQAGSFVRKGKAGDWKNYFTAEIKDLFKSKTGQFLIDFGFENDLDW